MKAVTYRKYGSPDELAIEQIRWPWPKANEVLVRVHTSSVTSGDVRMRGFRGAGIFWLPMRLIFGCLRPRNPVPGMEFSGWVSAIGKDVTRFKVGDAVFGMRIGGANAEYVVMPEAGAVILKPDTLSFEDAAAIPFGALSALTFLRDVARVQPGEHVLVYGASGAVGVFAVQLAKHFGAHVTGVCSTANTALVQSLGVDCVIDYSATNVARRAQPCDVLLDTVGATSFAHCRDMLAPRGRHVFLVHGLTELLQSVWTRLRPGKRVLSGFGRDATARDLELISGLVADGTLRPVIDRSYALDDIAAAHRYVETGRKRGAVLIAVGAEN